jgi:nitronate monooxygenase
VEASGGIATGAGIAAVLAAGASAAQIGTAFLLAPEAGTSPAHRRALSEPGTTVLTRAFTGRLARGLRNRFTEAHSARAPVAYPELHYVTAPMRRRAREDGDADLVNLWAGQAYELARELPATELVRVLAHETREALAAAEARADQAPAAAQARAGEAPAAAQARAGEAPAAAEARAGKAPAPRPAARP